MEDVAENKDQLIIYIGCPRFGGKRHALACAHYDRYRGCRRHCKSLETVMKENEDFLERVVTVYGERKDYMPSRHSCKGLPLQPLKCKYCEFVAKSERGMKSHMTRSHKGE